MNEIGGALGKPLAPFSFDLKGTQMPDLSTMKLGRMPHEPRPEIAPGTPQLDRHPILNATAVPTYPVALDRSRFAAFRPALDGNDRIGDCTAVGYANGARAAAALGGFGIDIQQAQTVGLYIRSCGYDPYAVPVDGENPTDRGGVLADVLAYQAQHGFDATNQMLVGDFATVDPANLSAVRATCARVGMLYCGVELAAADPRIRRAISGHRRRGRRPDPGILGRPLPGDLGLVRLRRYRSGPAGHLGDVPAGDVAVGEIQAGRMPRPYVARRRACDRGHRLWPVEIRSCNIPWIGGSVAGLSSFTSNRRTGNRNGSIENSRPIKLRAPPPRGETLGRRLRFSQATRVASGREMSRQFRPAIG